MIANTIIVALAAAGLLVLIIAAAFLAVGLTDLAEAYARGGTYLIIPLLTVLAMRWADKLER